MAARITHFRLPTCLLRLVIEIGSDESMVSPASKATLCSFIRPTLRLRVSIRTIEMTSARITMITKVTTENCANRLLLKLAMRGELARLEADVADVSDRCRDAGVRRKSGP